MKTPLLSLLLSIAFLPAFAEETADNTFWELNYQYRITFEENLTAAIIDF